jgi:DGQHR domain-containing protein
MTNQELKLHVIVVKQPIGEFYIASIKAKDLVEISYFDIRRLAEEQRDLEKYLGIQRPISKKRIKDLKQYIEARDATFPTAIIVAVDFRCAEYDKDSGILTLSPYTREDDAEEESIPYDRIAKVIDGQHRIAAFIDENKKWSFAFEGRDFELNLSIFVGADVSEQANMFATVNLAQTKVSRSLVYDLTELAKTASPYKTCHNVAVVLDGEPTSPLHQRIKRLGTATPRRKHEPLTQASFVEALVQFISSDPVQDRNDLLEGKSLKKPTPIELEKRPFRDLFIAERELDIAEILFNYFCAVRAKWPKSWSAVDVTGNLLPRSNAFKALMKFLKDDVYLRIVGNEIGRIPSPPEFSKLFAPIDFADAAFTTSKFAPGSGGQSMFLRMLRRQITLKDMIQE